MILAKDLLTNICQSTCRNLQRSVLKDRKESGEIIKRGRDTHMRKSTFAE